MTAPPLLVVVTGMPAAGKATLARELAARLDLPLVEKDEIKETLFDTLGVGDVEWSRRLGVAVYPLIFLFVRLSLAGGRPLIAETNFFHGGAEPAFELLPPHRLVQIHCRAPLDVLLERYEARPARHPGHVDRDRAGARRAVRERRERAARARRRADRPGHDLSGRRRDAC